MTSNMGQQSFAIEILRAGMNRECNISRGIVVVPLPFLNPVRNRGQAFERIVRYLLVLLHLYTGLSCCLVSLSVSLYFLLACLSVCLSLFLSVSV